jgi:hypothetical protein
MNWKDTVYNRTTWSIIFAIIAIICLVAGMLSQDNSKTKKLLITFIVFLCLTVFVKPEILIFIPTIIPTI